MNSQKRAILGIVLAIVAVIAGATTASAASILVLTGNGSSSLNAPLTAAGFTVINGTLAPGQIAANLTPAVEAVYIWNDGSLGGTFVPANPALDFNAADQTALTTFNSTRGNWIMDGLAWRGNGVPDEIALSKNEAIALVGAGGGIVLGADDASGGIIVQHVNQVASWFNFNSFGGVYSTLPANQYTGGSFFTTPNPVNPAGLTSSTTTYSEVPNGTQPNGIFLATAVFGSPSTQYPGFEAISPVLGPAVFDGVTYESVNHIITTNIKGGGIDDPVPEPGTFLLAAAGIGLAIATRRLKRG